VLIGRSVLVGVLLEFLLANTDDLSLTHEQSVVADGRSATHSRTVRHRLADLPKSVPS
jgi:hypothetical protein